MKLCIVALLAALLRAQEPAGVLEGSLRDAVSRAPLNAARISLRGVGRRAVTTVDGSFRFEQLPPGDYELAIEKAGYLDSTRGMAPKALHLKPGAVTQSAVLDLTPLGALEGAVLGEDGKPLSGVSVTVAGVSQTTAKDGRFDFADIVPGSYQVAVGVPHPVRSANLVRDASTGDFYGYGAAQYYPGADDARSAIPVEIPAGQRLRNVDLRLRRTLLVELTGRLVEMAGRQSVTDSEVQLIGALPGTPDPLWRRHPAGADGGFRFSLLQPGTYTLAVYRGGHQLPYVIAIELGKAGADELPVPLPPFPKLQGTIRLPDPKLHWEGSGSVRLVHQLAGSEAAPLKPDGTFEFASVPPGEYTVEVQPQSLHTAGDRTRKLFAREVHFGTHTGLRQPITVLENGNPGLEIELSNEPSGITGRVVESAERGTFYLNPGRFRGSRAEGR